VVLPGLLDLFHVHVMGLELCINSHASNQVRGTSNLFLVDDKHRRLDSKPEAIYNILVFERLYQLSVYVVEVFDLYGFPLSLVELLHISPLV
jgi:hypothetical protein